MRYHPALFQAITSSLLRTFSSFYPAAAAFASRGGVTVLPLFPPIDNNEFHRFRLRRRSVDIRGGRRHRIHSLRMSSNSSSLESSKKKNLVVDPFCYRQFAEKENSKGYAGAVFDMSIDQFEEIVNSRYNNPTQLKDGYAPFCKHLFLLNDFSNVCVNVLEITSENEQYLRTRYEARNADELPVLTRYFDRQVLLSGCKSGGGGGKDDGKEEGAIFPVAKYIDLILYSREQIDIENAAMGKTTADDDKEEEVRETAPWGIVSIKAQDVDYELPMTPITIMRNALGKDQGGSGVELVREAYMESVEYWKDRANVL